jgi:hypothetical protein
MRAKFEHLARGQNVIHCACFCDQLHYHLPCVCARSLLNIPVPECQENSALFFCYQYLWRKDQVCNMFHFQFGGKFDSSKCPKGVSAKLFSAATTFILQSISFSACQFVSVDSVRSIRQPSHHFLLVNLLVSILRCIRQPSHTPALSGYWRRVDDSRSQTATKTGYSMGASTAQGGGSTNNGLWIFRHHLSGNRFVNWC